MLAILCKTIGLSFYRQHVGLFLVAFYLLFGAVEGSQLISYHYAILMAICSSPLVLALLFVVWVLYAFKVLFFVKQQLALESHAFVKEINRLPNKVQYRLWFRLYAFVLAPILIYALLVICIAVKHQLYWSSIAAILGVIGLLVALTSYTLRLTNFVYKPSVNWINIPQFKFNRPFWLWPLFYLLQEQAIMLLVCKVVSMLFLKVILLLFADVGDDIRVYLTALLAVVLSHAILIFNLIKFDASYRLFARSLAINKLRTLANWFLLLILLLTPEFGLLIWLTNFGVLQFIYEVLFCSATMLFLFVLVYLLKADMERYMKYILFFFFINMLMILAGYYLLYSSTLLACAVALFLWKYPRMDLKELA